ncbi:riboflavin synthase [Psychrosphaera sp. 1_MG-2023]|uniref:Riboflavin synthase n=1 Tax=Psychrosphaera algicola TaxID=3023714 RepID=A0ABT5F9N2_9GAMM|nr:MULTISPECIES: riboflavin synthase [unclassified Psychrosphaera]MDC2888243.1 riboflavin synthase [Psychrosphaera sp. G1-22]MDO6718350.1 riboflavin synthase [Psychrosphaera sp. 1_MG-2023]
MFTGIIEATGKIKSLSKLGGDLKVTIESSDLDMSDVKLGDSIATNGVCLTVVEKLSNGFVADVSNETITNSGFRHYQIGQAVNLEKAMLATSRFGGHIVSGHVDGIATIAAIIDNGRAKDIWINAPAALLKYVITKGSITVDGISLTINNVEAGQFKLTVVPHTASQTTLSNAVTGSSVNIEIDIIARYLEKLANPSSNEGVSMSLLARSGFLK